MRQPADRACARGKNRSSGTAYTLATLAELGIAVDGEQPASVSPGAPPPAGDVVRRVYGAFASTLKLPVDEITKIDRLDALGCTSFQIVEITVALTQHFPWLPSTLLFEHRSVNDIAAHIAQLAGTGAAPSASAGGAPRAARGPASAGDIAVVGLDVRCAGASSPAELWALLSTGGVAVLPVPADRQQFLQPLRDARPHWAGLVDDVDRFDAEFFGIAPREAALMDPQLRIFLEVAWNALEDAGCAGADLDPDTGVFAGVMYADYAHEANRLAAGGASPYKSLGIVQPGEPAVADSRSARAEPGCRHGLLLLGHRAPPGLPGAQWRRLPRSRSLAV